MSSRGPVIDFPNPSGSSSRAPAPYHSSASKFEAPVCFNRQELNLILSRYGMMVAAGHWRDYAIDMQKDCAVFSIYRHTSERPLFRLEKHPKLQNKQGAYLVMNERGMILKRGRDLGAILKIFDKRLELITGA